MSEHTQSSTSQRTLLIVDDERSVCVALEYFLSGAGYRILTAGSGAAAVALADKEPIDGALIDVHMPVLNGFDTCRQLYAGANRAGRPPRVWFMTGAFTGALEKRCADVGGFCVFSKPFDFSTLLGRLEEGFAAPPPSIEIGAQVKSGCETSVGVTA